MSFTRMFGAALAAVALLFVGPSAPAATISYGNFGPVPPGVSFLNVAESSGTDAVPLYGPPTVFPVGLDFMAMNFVATASGAAAPDITNGQLNFTVTTTAASQRAVRSIGIAEAGDFSLSGAGTATTQALAGAILRASVTAIDGVSITPIDLTPVNASVAFNLLANEGIVQPWSIGLTLDVQGQLLARNIPFTLGATRVDVALDNQLTAISEPASVAFITKKDFAVTADSVTAPVPEPAAAGLLALSLGALAARRARRG